MHPPLVVEQLLRCDRILVVAGTDIATANELGIPSLWINRLGEMPDPEPTRELPDLVALTDTLDDLLPS